MKKIKHLPVRVTMCATCPFRNGSPTEQVKGVLIERIMREASHICHSTGRDNAFNRRTGKREHLCRGARNIQLWYFAKIGFIPEATDTEWNKARVKQGMPEQIIKDP